jgi:DNA-binding transcriptional ArsR family regulator
MTDGRFEDALSALANESRVAILRALADADRPLSFTELRSRTSIEDPGRFNYHLKTLCEHYLQERADGYDLNYRGKRLVVLADEGVGIEDSGGTAAETCPVCGETDCDRLIHVHLESPDRLV